jgi:hypothetical protein
MGTLARQVPVSSLLNIQTASKFGPESALNILPTSLPLSPSEPLQTRPICRNALATPLPLKEKESIDETEVFLQPLIILQLASALNIS